MKKIITLLMIFALMCSSGTSAFAANSEVVDYYSRDISLCESDQEFLNKVVEIAEYWYIDESTNKLCIDLTESQLKTDFQFTEDEYARLLDEVVGVDVSQDVSTSISGSSEETLSPEFYISNGTLYIEYADLVGGTFAVLVVAAEAGPAAMTAAITALSTALGGTVGTIVGLALGLSAADLCIRVLYAVATEQGIYIKPVLSYPLLEIGYF